MRAFAFAFAVVLVACHGSDASKPRSAERAPDPGPPVDEDCLQRAREGRLIATQPAEAAGFAVTPTETGVRLIRNGRDLTGAEGKALWRLFSAEYFSRGGFSTGSSALHSVEKCSEVGDASCLSLDVYVCQRDLATIAAWVAEAAARSGAPDGELAIDLDFIERRGPSCTRGGACTPAAHYSTPNARYDPSGPRHRQGGRGRCTTDGDCEGKGSNQCLAWYLRGGAETLLYVHHGEPTFCGCIERTCSWFTQ